MLHSLLDSAHCSEHGGLQGKALSIWKCNANSEPSKCFHTSAEGKIWYLFLVSFDNFFTSLLHFLILHLILNTYNIYPGIIICSYIFHVFYIYLQKYHNINILRSFIIPLRPWAILWLDASGESIHRASASRPVNPKTAPFWLGAGQIVLVVQDFFIYLRKCRN